MSMGLFEQYCLQFVGLPYRWGGDDPMAGFDCSGLTLEVLSAFGAGPGGDTTAQGLHDWILANGGKRVDPPATGAIAFYGGGVRQITHVAICLTERLMIEAGGGGSKTTSLPVAIQQNACVRIRPIKRRDDLVAVLMPVYRGGLP